MANVLPILLFALAGILVGGAASLRRQGAPIAVVVVMAALSLLAVVAGAVRLIYGGD